MGTSQTKSSDSLWPLKSMPKNWPMHTVSEFVRDTKHSFAVQLLKTSKPSVSGRHRFNSGAKEHSVRTRATAPGGASFPQDAVPFQTTSELGSRPTPGCIPFWKCSSRSRSDALRPGAGVGLATSDALIVRVAAVPSVLVMRKTASAAIWISIPQPEGWYLVVEHQKYISFTAASARLSKVFHDSDWQTVGPSMIGAQPQWRHIDLPHVKRGKSAVDKCRSRHREAESQACAAAMSG